MPSLLLIEKYCGFFCDFFTVTQQVKVSYKKWRKALYHLTCAAAMGQFASTFVLFHPQAQSTNGLRKDKKAVIKFRAYHHRALPNASFIQDMANHLPVNATGRPRHQS